MEENMASTLRMQGVHGPTIPMDISRGPTPGSGAAVCAHSGSTGTRSTHEQQKRASEPQHDEGGSPRFSGSGTASGPANGNKRASPEPSTTSASPEHVQPSEHSQQHAPVTSAGAPMPAAGPAAQPSHTVPVANVAAVAPCPAAPGPNVPVLHAMSMPSSAGHLPTHFPGAPPHARAGATAPGLMPGAFAHAGPVGYPHAPAMHFMMPDVGRAGPGAQQQFKGGPTMQGVGAIHPGMMPAGGAMPMAHMMPHMQALNLHFLGYGAGRPGMPPGRQGSGGVHVSPALRHGLTPQMMHENWTRTGVAPLRAAQLQRYRYKRMLRQKGAKKIRYQCRKTLADARPRVKGRFAKVNAPPGAPGEWQGPGSDGGGSGGSGGSGAGAGASLQKQAMAGAVRAKAAEQGTQLELGGVFAGLGGPGDMFGGDDDSGLMRKVMSEFNLADLGAQGDDLEDEDWLDFTGEDVPEQPAGPGARTGGAAAPAQAPTPPKQGVAQRSSAGRAAMPRSFSDGNLAMMSQHNQWGSAVEDDTDAFQLALATLREDNELGLPEDF
ncbi:unnamed protein product [Pedinophyceae sp. YPF-701]|nr:unnamed protein product [Pedinophyceae sp. YPF-701]